MTLSSLLGSCVSLSASARLALANLRHRRAATGLTVGGIAIAVLAMTLLASAGFGAVDAGEQKYTATGRDLWITGGTSLSPGSVGGITNGIQDAHRTSSDIEFHPNVRSAVPMAVQTVYVGTDPGELQPVVGVGVPGDGLHVRMTDGRYFEGGDVHYANGAYSGPATNEVVLSEELTRTLGVSVGDELHIGGTIADARRTRVTVIGTTAAFSGFLSAPTAALRLSELQETTGKTALDPASVIMVTLESDAKLESTQNQLQQRYPEYRVRTNREQLQRSLDRHATVIASGAVLVTLALAAGLALTTNMLVLFVSQQRRAVAAALAQGISSRTLVPMVVFQGLFVGVLGGTLGLLATPFAVAALNMFLEQYLGLTAVLRLSPLVLGLGALVAIGTTLVSSTIAGWRLASITPLEHLD